MDTVNTQLTEKLAELRALNCEALPTPQLGVITRLTARLRRSGILGTCLRPGETVPDFMFAGASGEQTSLYQWLDAAPVVLNFFRGLWCAYCRTEIEAYNSIRSDLTGLGVRYLAISPHPLPAEFVGEPGFQMVFDANNTIARSFGLIYGLTSEEIALFQSWGVDPGGGNCSLPLPATYLVDRDGSVFFRSVDVDYRARCCPGDLIREIRSLVQN